jgi:hypothetical protein
MTTLGLMIDRVSHRIYLKVLIDLIMSEVG